MSARALFGTAWSLVAALAVASVILVIGQSEQQTFPSITSTRPSGTAAFAELLRRSGYTVIQDRGQSKRFDPQATVIAFDLGLRNLKEASRKLVMEHLANGGRVLILAIGNQFDQATLGSAGATIVYRNNLDSKSRSYLVTGEFSTSDLFYFLDAAVTFDLYLTDENTPVEISKVGAGFVTTIGPGIAATNRFLDKADNAAFMLELTRRLAGPRKKLIFAESTFGNNRRTDLWEDLGDWASAARWQAVLTVLVIALTLGLRFGHAEKMRSVARGTRDLLDGFADVMTRGRKADLALKLIGEHVAIRLASALRLPRGESLESRFESDPRLLALLKQSKGAGRIRAKEASQQAVELLQRTETIEATEKARR